MGLTKEELFIILEQEANTMAEVHEGGCLCGAIRYRTKGNPLRAHVCHCTDCQRRTGSAFATIVWFADEDVKITGDTLSVYEHRSDESNRLRRSHFCHRCGTTVMWTNDHRPGVRILMVGTLDDPNWVKIGMHTWTRSAQHWVAFPQDVPRFEIGSQGAEITPST